MLANNLAQNMTPQRVPGPQDVQAILGRASFLRKNPQEQKNPGELDGLMKYIQHLSSQGQQQQQPPLTNGHAVTNGSGPSLASAITSGPIPTQLPPTSQTPVSFTPDQINALRAQIHAFKLITRGLPVPDNIQQALRVPNNAVPELEKLLQGSDVNGRVVDNADEDIDPADMPKGPFMEDDVNSGIYPYNAYRHPFTHLKRPADVDPKLFATRLQRLIIPTIMPTGLDARQIIEERDRFIEARMQQRIRELESLPSTMGDGGFETGLNPQDIVKDEKENSSDTKPDPSSLPTLISSTSHGKIRALIELKSLRLLDKQRLLRAQVAETLTHGSLLPLNRPDFRRYKKPTIRDARVTEQLERKQRIDRERRAKSKHVEQLDVICQHAIQVVTVNRSAQDRVVRLGRSVLNFHQYTEKEEQKRMERIAKERIKALKADDEEAYMALVDNVKDTRITHLLRQTDSYLDSLAQAVASQQNESGPMDMRFEMEQGPATEATFGAKISAEDAKENSNAKVDYYAVAHRISEKITRQPSLLVGGTLKEYQIKGLQWMVSLYNNRLNGILADEMGLGKTIQTISLITFLIESKRLNGPYLVIVPLSTMTNWSGEFAKWAPSLKVVAYKGNPAQRRALQGELRVGHFHVLLTTYEYIIKDRPILCKIKWLHMIIDEGHRMKNTQSKLTVTLTTYYHSRYRLLLSGTPLQNNLTELWSLLNFVLPKIFNSVKSFDEWFNTPFANSGTGDKIELSEEEALLIIRRLHKVLRPFLLRRLKKDVESELPDKVEKVIKVRMSALQSQMYKQMKKHKMIADGNSKNGKQGGVKGLSNELMQLRKICQHPFLFESVEDKMNPGGLVDDKLIRNSGKIELLNRILPKFFAAGHRVLIFFQMTKVMDIMADFLTMMGWKFLRLDGGTKTEERANFVQLFNAKDSEYKVFILSTRAGGLGLNLQTADTVIIFDSDWNPHADLQAQDRAHRIGQTKAVLILRFITEKSVEEAMYQRARYKLDIDDKVIQAGRFDNKSTQEEQEEFLRSILEAEEDEENEEAGDMNDDELNSIIARNEDESELFREMDMKRERDALENWRAQGHRGKPPPPLTQFEELPECYQNDEPFEVTIIDEAAEGRGQRRRNVVSYSDGLDDETWAMALEDGEDLEELAEREQEERNEQASQRRRGFGSGHTRLGFRLAKRKRGVKSISASPSVNDDDDDDRQPKRRKAPPKSNGNDVTPAVREKMKKIFNECYRAVVACEDADGRKRCELFRELPDKHDYPDYYQLITQPIALSHLRKRASGSYYKDLQHYRSDWTLMFNNARTYNQEGSWVYIDAVEMEKVLDATFKRLTVGSGLPGAQGGGGGSSGSYESALTPMDEDDRPPPPSRGRSSTRRQVISDEEYLTPSDDD
ncbi:Chromatin structure-remodeling complex subunit snf21 [Mycena venus]|uniref:Chromatin structure-remodeling complex subunit snf21 n=1 Tax=Mycena venus TaxID=2733690 RepID=A0A8H6XEX4_9AGAR|nr:Chromatin structure-remodeling complex subunit snf21 [Mycena venus]